MSHTVAEEAFTRIFMVFSCLQSVKALYRSHDDIYISLRTYEKSDSKNNSQTGTDVMVVALSAFGAFERKNQR